MCVDLPHTITSAILHKVRIQNINEIPKNRRPPYGIWDKEFALEEWIDHMWDDDKKKEKEVYLDYKNEDVE